MYVCKDLAPPAHARTRTHSTQQARGATTPEPELRRVTDTVTHTSHTPRYVRRPQAGIPHRPP